MPQMPPESKSGESDSEPRFSAFVIMILALLFVFGLISRIGRLTPETSSFGMSENSQAERVSTTLGEQPALTPRSSETEMIHQTTGQTTQEAYADSRLLEVLREEQTQGEATSQRQEAEASQSSTSSTEEASNLPDEPESTRVILPARDRRGDRLGPGPAFANSATPPASQKNSAPASRPERVPQYRSAGGGLAVPDGGASAEDSVPDIRTHVLRTRETLWTISRKYYGAGREWKVILRANPGLNPKRLRPGMRIVIPPLSETEPLALVNTAE